MVKEGESRTKLSPGGYRFSVDLSQCIRIFSGGQMGKARDAKDKADRLAAREAKELVFAKLRDSIREAAAKSEPDWYEQTSLDSGLVLLVVVVGEDGGGGGWHMVLVLRGCGGTVIADALLHLTWQVKRSRTATLAGAGAESTHTRCVCRHRRRSV